VKGHLYLASQKRMQRRFSDSKKDLVPGREKKGEKKRVPPLSLSSEEKRKGTFYRRGGEGDRLLFSPTQREGGRG